MENKEYNDLELITGETALPKDAEEELEFRRPKRLRKKKILLITLISLAAAALIAFGSIFIYNLFSQKSDSYDHSRAFYFTSDLLTENGGSYAAIGSIDFNIRNYADELRTSREVIKGFEITVKADGKDITDKADINAGTKTLKANERTDCPVSIILPEEYHGMKIDVICVSSPIEITLTGSFDLKPEWSYEVKDFEGSNAATVVITANENISLDLHWNTAIVCADTTNPYVKSGDIEGGNCNVTLAAGMSTSIAFFKADTKLCLVDDTGFLKFKEVAPAEPEDQANEESQTPESEDTASGLIPQVPNDTTIQAEAEQ